MDDQTRRARLRRARLARAADILQALLDEYHDEYDAWDSGRAHLLHRAARR